MTRTLDDLRGRPAHELATLAGLDLSLAQSTILRAVGGAPLAKPQLQMFRRLTGTAGVLGLGRTRPSPEGYRDVYLRCGRRSGKSTRIAAPLAIEALLRSDVDGLLGPGETARVLCVAPRRDQVRTLLDSCSGLLDRLGVTHEKINAAIRVPGLRVVIETTTADGVAPRGPTAVCAIIDEAALLPYVEGSEGYDRELIAAIRPALATTGGRLIVASTPWGREGFHFERVETLLGAPTSRAVAFEAPTWTMNPAHFPSEAAARENEDDPRIFDREWRAVPGDLDSSAFSSTDLAACVDIGRRGSPPIRGTAYSLGYDEGGRQAARALVITHREWRPTPDGSVEYIVVDFLKRWQPGSGIAHDEVMSEVASIAKRYSNARIQRDLFAGDAVNAALSKLGARSEEVSMAPAAQAARFRYLQHLVETGRIRLVDDDQLLRELRGLRETLQQAGRVTFAKGSKRGEFDDLADALALSVEHAKTLPAGGGAGIREEIVFERGDGRIVGIKKVYLARHTRSDGGERWVPTAAPPGTGLARHARRVRWLQGAFTPDDLEQFGDDLPARIARGDYPD